MLFCNIDLLDEKFETKRNQYVGVKDGRIAYIGASEPEEDFGERYDGRHRLLMPAFYNVHSHAPMTLLRGYAENLPLQRWLGEKVFPFEDQIDDEAAYYGTLLAISEMLASGTASFSDMYFFFGGMVPAILESGIKCNLSRGLTVFDDSDYTDLPAYRDNVRLRGEWNGANNGRLIGDLCIHGEYTSNPKIVEAVVGYGFMVDPETGKRFVNETGNRKVRSDAIVATGHPAVLAVSVDNVGHVPAEALKTGLEKGVVKTFDSAEALADFHKIPNDAFMASLKTWNEAVKAKKDPAFNAKIFDDTKVNQGKFYSIRLWPRVHYTMGGLAITPKAEVIDMTGSVIPGLYAAGEVTGGFHGRSYLGSTAFGKALIFGYIAAGTILKA